MPAYSSFLEVDTGYAMVTSGGFSSQTYRPNFDVSVPVFSSLAVKLKRTKEGKERPWLVISSQPNIHEEFRETIAEMAAEHPSFLVLDTCASKVLDTTIRCRDDELYSYPDVLQVITDLQNQETYRI